MSNLNSVNLSTSRYVHGGITEVTPFSIEWWDRIRFPRDVSDVQYAVDSIYEGRLDLIANKFYDSPKLWWIIAQYNNILDITGEIITGRILLIPTKSRVYKEFLVGKTGGKISSREPETIFLSTLV